MPPIPDISFVEKQPRRVPIPFIAQGTPMGIPVAVLFMTILPSREIPPLAMPGSNLKRAISYYADYGGCGFWRMVYPEMILNGKQKAVVNGMTAMVLDPRFYNGISAVKLQRQATPIQKAFVKFLKEGGGHMGFKILYEVDDVVFPEDIPIYNRCRDAFTDPEIAQSILEMMRMADEVVVASKFMKEYYRIKTGNQKISYIPNYPPKMWFDRFYDEKKAEKRYKKYKNQPRIGYFGSGTHIDVINRAGQKDDFHGVVQDIIKTRKKFKWVFYGAFPIACKPFIDVGEMEYHDWVDIFEFPYMVGTADLNAVYAPLEFNNFNRSKSNIKFLETAAVGLPGVFQNLEPYEESYFKFNNGEEFIAQLETLLGDEDLYMKTVRKGRQYAEKMWLDNENNHMKHWEALFTPYASPERKFLLETNPEQKPVLEQKGVVIEDKKE